MSENSQEHDGVIKLLKLVSKAQQEWIEGSSGLFTLNGLLRDLLPLVESECCFLIQRESLTAGESHLKVLAIADNSPPRVANTFEEQLLAKGVEKSSLGEAFSRVQKSSGPLLSRAHQDLLEKNLSLILPLRIENELAGYLGFVGRKHSFDEGDLEYFAPLQRCCETLLSARLRKRQARLRSRDERQSKMFLDSVVENIPNMIFIKEAGALRFHRFNKAGEELLGTSRDELLGKNDYDLFPEEQANFFIEKDREVLRGRKAVLIEEEPIDTEPHGLRYLRTRKIPLLDDRGEPQFLLGISEDITESKKAQDALLEAKLKAERATKAKGEFLAHMSHEVRTPLNGIIGMTELLLDTSLVEEQQECVEMIKSSADTLLTIINDILDFSKIGAEKLELSPSHFDFKELLKETEAIFHPSLLSKNIELVLEVGETVPKYVFGDRIRVKQILVNLLGNGIKFTREDAGMLLIVNCLEHSEKEVRLRFHVIDSGIGIDSKKLEDIFQPFEQEDESTTRSYGGTGLGLAIASQLVEKMGGKISVVSQKGMGTRFTFDLVLKPSLEEIAEESEESEEEARQNHARNLLILLAEDNAVNQKMMLRLLEKLGHEVVMVEDGQSAVEASQKQSFDLVLMDIQMPVMGGIEATHEIRNIQRKTGQSCPIVALTANSMKGDRERYLGEGMDDYVSKPLRRDELLAVIDRVVGQPPVDDK